MTALSQHSAMPMPNADMAGADLFRNLVALVVDDSSSQRKMLRLLLEKWDFTVLEAADGLAGLAQVQSSRVDFIISDWMMPEMSGPEFCRAVRDVETENYIYFILLTSKRDKNEVAAGLEAGADDFLSKPMDMGEMLARLRAGRRLLAMHEDLIDKNRRISEAFDQLNEIYEGIDRDLKQASRLQKALIPPNQARCEGVDVGICYEPSGHVGGDLVGYFRVSQHRLAIYSIDVSGHGVSSALMTARLANLLNGERLDENVAVTRDEAGAFKSIDPAALAVDLNERLQDEADCDQYFTMAFAIVDTQSGIVRFCQAGHPNPVVIRVNGEIEFVGEGGAPIGLITDVDYATDVVHLEPGDRMMMLSDGMIEAEDSDGNMLEEAGLKSILEQAPCVPEHEVLAHTLDAVRRFANGGTLDDDVSAILYTMP